MEIYTDHFTSAHIKTDYVEILGERYDNQSFKLWLIDILYRYPNVKLTIQYRYFLIP